MPDYSFFLSYASKDRIQLDRESEATNKNDLIRVFFEDLNREMNGQGYADGGFFDKKRLEARWEDELEEGLASSRILVALYSPNYFKSVYCGKEWETFNQRFEENEKHRYYDVTNSTVILPVYWKGPVTLPGTVAKNDIEYLPYPADYEKFGLEYLMMFKRNTAAYRKFLFNFRIKLTSLAAGQGTAKVRDVLDFDGLNPPFPGQNTPGLKFVRYVVVAGMKQQMKELRIFRDNYANFADRRDWRPCFPDQDRPVEGIATAPAKRDNRDFVFVEPSPQLMDQLREARKLNNVVVVMVDPCSVRLPEMRKFLDDFDGDAEGFPNSAVLVNWNWKDKETSEQAAELEKLLKDRFVRRMQRKEFHKDPVSSPDAIEKAVEEAFAAVQARLVELGRISAAGSGGSSQMPVIRNLNPNG